MIIATCQLFLNLPKPRQSAIAAFLLFAVMGFAGRVLAQDDAEGARAPQAVEVGAEASVETENSPVTTVIKVTPGCDSAVNIVYEQRNTIARVEGSIEKSSCPASRGEYTAMVSFRDVTGELKSLEFVEPWQRNDDNPISFLNEYEIGENVDLVSVRMRRLRCSCTEASAE